MTDQPITASLIISFSTELENKSARFYEKLGELFPEHREAFASYAKRCEKNKTLVIRTYQETITDALEAGFSFEGLNLQNYELDLDLPEEASLAEALALALELEGKALAFYQEAAELSQPLLATIPRAFKRVAKKRRRQISELQSLHETLE